MNPIIFRQGVCDPHIHIFEGKAYLYATKDSPGGRGYTGFNMTEWQVWSSEDLLHWTLENRMFPEDFYCGSINQCWATDAAEYNGKYYWYFSRGDAETGVGVSDHPGGPFRDALGKALLDAETSPVNIPKWDPCCFIDDDGSAYIIVGYTRLPAPNDKYLIAKLNKDMISLAEDLRSLDAEPDPCCGDDKASIHKKNGLYYLSHASFYATAEHVYGPYVYRGNFAANNDHGSFFTYHNQDYNASGGMDNPSMCCRASYLHYVHYRANGEIVIDKQIGQYGVGQYDACWKRIEAEWFFAADGISKRENKNGGFEIQDIHSGDFLFYQNVNNTEENTLLTFRASCHSKDGGKIIIANGNEGNILGSVSVTDTGSWDNYQEFSTRLTNPAGTLQLYLTFESANEDSSEELFRLDSFYFGDSSTYRQCSEGYTGVKTGAVTSITDARANAKLVTGSFHDTQDSLRICVDGGKNAELSIQYINNSNHPASLKMSINGRPGEILTFTSTEKNQKSTLILHPDLADGINIITFSGEDNRSACDLYIDNLIVTRPRDIYCSYAAGNGDYFPRGNGCWDSLPQTQTEPFAFSGRMLNTLKKDQSGAVFSEIEGNDSQVSLAFHYSCLEDCDFEISINDCNCGSLHFEANGFDCMEESRTLVTNIFLPQGKNQITLVKTGDKGSLSLDALTVMPQHS